MILPGAGHERTDRIVQNRRAFLPPRLLKTQDGPVLGWKYMCCFWIAA